MTVPFRKIMLTLDGSELALQALPAAVAVADRFDAELFLFRVLHDLRRKTDLGLMEEDEKVVLTGIQRREEALVSEKAGELRMLASRLDLPQPQVTVRVEVGDAAQLIVERIRTLDIDMVVMCTHGRTGLSRQLRGSIAEHVLHHADCPVLLVRADLSQKRAT